MGNINHKSHIRRNTFTELRTESSDLITETLKLNPLNVFNVVQTILTHLEFNDLLNCRLVNHTWNQESIQVLRKRGCTVRLDSKNTSKYLNLISPGHFKKNLSLGNFKLLLSTHFTKSECDYHNMCCNRNKDVYSYAINHINSNVTLNAYKNWKLKHDTLNLFTSIYQVIEIFGEYSFHSLEWSSATWCKSDTIWRTFLSLVRMMAPGLQSIFIGQIGYKNFENLILFVDFPMLETLHFEGATFQHNYEHQISMISLAPKLTNLNLFSKYIDFQTEDFEDEFIHSVKCDNAFRILNRLEFGIAVCLKKLSLYLYENLTGILHPESLCGFELLTLTDLKIYSSGSMMFETEISELATEFIVQKCPSLQRLDFVFHHRGSQLSKFADLLSNIPTLVHFGCHATHPDACTNYIDHPDNKTNQIQKGTDFILQEYFPSIDYMNVHPSLTSLHLHYRVFLIDAKQIKSWSLAFDKPQAFVISVEVESTRTMITPSVEIHKLILTIESAPLASQHNMLETTDFLQNLYSTILGQRVSEIIIQLQIDGIYLSSIGHVFVKGLLDGVCDIINDIELSEIRQYEDQFKSEVLPGNVVRKSRKGLQCVESGSFRRCFCLDSSLNHLDRYIDKESCQSTTYVWKND